MSQAILVLLADLVNHLYQDCLVIQSLLFLVLPFRPSHLESLETPQGPFHLDNIDTMSSYPAASILLYF